MSIGLVIKDRAISRVPREWLREIGILGFYVAGNCLNRMAPLDIDLFPLAEHDFDNLPSSGRVSSTKNADTYLAKDGTIVQFCHYWHGSLVELVESFDFAHIKVGVKIDENEIKEVYYSKAWEDAHAMETTWYTGSRYPLSSLMRLVKYVKRDVFSGKSWLPSALGIVMDIAERGFKDYDDFKDQLDAVDLGLVEKDLQGCDLGRLFKALNKG